MNKKKPQIGSDKHGLKEAKGQFLVYQAMRRIPMYMKDWIKKLGTFLSINDRDILNHAGKPDSDGLALPLRARPQRATGSLWNMDIKNAVMIILQNGFDKHS